MSIGSTTQQLRVNKLLTSIAHGDAKALQGLYAELYPEIKRIAHSRLRQAGGSALLSTTVVANDGFLRLASQHKLTGQSVLEFFAYVGHVLRSVVIDHIRSENAAKRAGEHTHLTLSNIGSHGAHSLGNYDVIDFDLVLEKVKQIDTGLYQTVEMVAFTGMSVDEVAQLKSVTVRTVNRDLAKARALIESLLNGGTVSSPKVNA
jgi:RNA polymerase sigma factor (TIGR02999 family)